LQTFRNFPDLENLAKSLEKYDKTPQELLQKILDTFVGMGKIDVARVYTGWVFCVTHTICVDMDMKCIVYAHRSVAL